MSSGTMLLGFGLLLKSSQNLSVPSVPQSLLSPAQSSSGPGRVFWAVRTGPAKGLLSDSGQRCAGDWSRPADHRWEAGSQTGSLSRIMKGALLFCPPARPGLAAGLLQTLNPTDKQVGFHLCKALRHRAGLSPAEGGTNSPERSSGMMSHSAL